MIIACILSQTCSKLLGCQFRCYFKMENFNTRLGMEMCKTDFSLSHQHSYFLCICRFDDVIAKATIYKNKIDSLSSVFKRESCRFWFVKSRKTWLLSILILRFILHKKNSILKHIALSKKHSFYQLFQNNQLFKKNLVKNVMEQRSPLIQNKSKKRTGWFFFVNKNNNLLCTISIVWRVKNFSSSIVYRIFCGF